MPASSTDRRAKRREPLDQGRRRYPRVFLDLDWFLESPGCSTLGRGLELSPRGALLPIQRTTPLSEVTLFVSLPSRPRLFRAEGVASPRAGDRGWVIRFTEVAVDDLKLLGETLIEEYGLAALPALGRRFQRFTELHRRFLRSSP